MKAFKRETLLRNLKAVAERIPKLDLPANIVAIYAFGGMLREKRRLRDFDLVFLYSMSDGQKERWDRFLKSFSTYDPESGRDPLGEIWAELEPYWRRGIPLSEAVKDEGLSRKLSERGTPPHWAGCFSWTDIFGIGHMGVFVPDIRKVIRRMLLGRGMKGLQVLVERYEDFEKGEAWLLPKNFVLAWSPERPNIEENLERPQREKVEFAIKEAELFTRQIAELRKKWEGALEAVSKLGKDAGVRLDLEALARQHVEVSFSGGEPYDELLRKLEGAREEMRKYEAEAAVLRAVGSALERLLRNRPLYSDYPAEEYVCLWTIEGIPKREVEEVEIRRVLRALGLPEERVVAVKEWGRTQYELPRDEGEKLRLLKRVEVEGKRRELLAGVMRAIRPLDRRAKAYVEVGDHGRPVELRILVTLPFGGRKVADELRGKGFEARDWGDCVSCYVEVGLKGNESPEELQRLARQAVQEVWLSAQEACR